MMESEESNNTTLTFKRAVEIYRLLVKKSKLVDPIDLIEYGYPITKSGQVRTFTGIISDVAAKIGLSNHQKGDALGVLNAMDCITKLRTSGGHKSPGLWILNYEPTPEQYNEFRQTNLRILRKTLPTQRMQTLQQISELLSEIKNTQEVVRLLEERVAELESQVGHNIRQSSSVSGM